MKICNIFHSRDLDGWMSAAIVKLAFKDEPSINFLGWDYGDPIPDLSEYDKIIMCDVSFPMDVFNNLHTCGIAITWIDHHKSAIDEYLNYEGISGLENFAGFTVVYNTKKAACELTWEHYFTHEDMPEIVRLLGRYDCSGHKGTEEEQEVLEFQYGARQVITNYEEAYECLQQDIAIEGRLDDEYFISTLSNDREEIHSKGRIIYQYLCTEAKQIYKKAFEIELSLITEFEDVEIGDLYSDKTVVAKRPVGTTYKFLCVNQERFNPINFGIDYHKDGYDGFACFWYKDGKWSFSLYNDNGKVDCSTIAKSFGGGGHKGAAGMVVDTPTMLKIISND